MMFPKEAAQPIMRFIDCGPQLWNTKAVLLVKNRKIVS